MGVSLVITSANITEIPYMEVLKIVVSAMFGFRHLLGSIGVACSLACSYLNKASIILYIVYYALYDMLHMHHKLHLEFQPYINV